MPPTPRNGDWCYHDRHLPTSSLKKWFSLPDSPFLFICRTVPTPRGGGGMHPGFGRELADTLGIGVWYKLSYTGMEEQKPRENEKYFQTKFGLLAGDLFSFLHMLWFTIWPTQRTQDHFKFIILWSTESDEENMYCFLKWSFVVLMIFL